MTKDIIFIGGGGHFKVAYNIALSCKTKHHIIPKNYYNILGVYDDEDPSKTLPRGVKYLGKLEQIPIHRIRAFYFISIGNNKVREQIFDQLVKLPWMNLEINLIHPSAILPEFGNIGCGNLICAGTVIEPDVLIGNCNIINTNASVNHDCKIGNFVHLAPGTTLCGHVIVEDCTLIGAGTTIIPRITVGSNSTIGSQSNVVKDIPENILAYGNPCQVIKSIPPPKPASPDQQSD
jgi:sugar O-acyltransferase (sialic acid O-acetyltransferase NeuD family)